MGVLGGADCLIAAAAQLKDVCKVEQDAGALVRIVRCRRETESVLNQRFGWVEVASACEKPCSN